MATYFSDRFVSLNKIVIAAAVAYAGAGGFAHASDQTDYACVYNNVCEHTPGHVTDSSGIVHEVHIGDHIHAPSFDGMVIATNSEYVLLRSTADSEHTSRIYPSELEGHAAAARQNDNVAITFVRTAAMSMALNASSAAMSAGATRVQAAEEAVSEGEGLELQLIDWSHEDQSQDWRNVPRDYQQAVQSLRRSAGAASSLAATRDAYWADWGKRLGGGAAASTAAASSSAQDDLANRAAHGDSAAIMRMQRDKAAAAKQ
jgi:hypothetical protein